MFYVLGSTVELLFAVAILAIALSVAAFIVCSIPARRAAREEKRLRTDLAELGNAKQTLEETCAQLSKALEAESAANSEKAQFLAAMSHELRTPLNAIIGFADLMSMETFGTLGSPRYREYLKDIRSSGAHLLSLINDILDLSRPNARTTQLEDNILELPAITGEMLRMVRQDAVAAGVTLTEAIEPQLPSLRGDGKRIRQILINLLTNAIKFTPAGGSIRLSAFRRSGEIRLAVSDSGIGIADIPKALERFGQVESHLSGKFDGLGLGLPLAKQYMEAHGGRLDIASELGKGTTVTVSFPPWRIASPARATA
jgi:signal transduction histidine kinase